MDNGKKTFDSWKIDQHQKELETAGKSLEFVVRELGALRFSNEQTKVENLAVRFVAMERAARSALTTIQSQRL